MKTFRIVLGILSIIPLTLLADKMFFGFTGYDEDSLRTLAFLIIGIPILILNLWIWIYPEIIEFYFLGNSKNKD
jgi:hypothetical protein